MRIRMNQLRIIVMTFDLCYFLLLNYYTIILNLNIRNIVIEY